MKMEQTECSETSAYKIQTPGNYPEESIQQIITYLPKSSDCLFLFLASLITAVSEFLRILRLSSYVPSGYFQFPPSFSTMPTLVIVNAGPFLLFGRFLGS